VVLTDGRLRDLAARLARVGGVRGVILGGSRARGAEELTASVHAAEQLVAETAAAVTDLSGA
jgi:hypothetical protein